MSTQEQRMAGDAVTPAKESVTDARSGSGRALRLVLQWGVPALILVVLGYVLFSRLSPVELAGILSQSAPQWLLVGLLFYALTNIARAVRMVRLLGRPYSRAVHLIPVMFALSLFNNVLPMRTGELSFPYLMQQDGVEWGSSLAALLVSRLFDLLAVCSLFLAAAVAQSSLLSASATGFVAAAVGLIILLFVVLVSLPALPRRLLGFLQARLLGKDVPATGWRTRIALQVEKAANALEVMCSGRVYWPALFHSFLIWLGTYFWFASYLKGVGLPMDIGRVILGASFAVLSKSLPIGSIGGLGAHEAGWTLGFTLLGQEVSTAILGGLAVNLLTLLGSAIFGLGSLGWLALRSGRSLSSYLPRAMRKRSSAQGDRMLPLWQWNRHWLIVVCVSAFVVLGTLYSVVTPLFETPDEVWHYLYVKHIADGGGLPVYQEGVTFPMHQEASQPPLYYLLSGWATAWIDTTDAGIVVRYNPHAAIGVPSAWGNRNVISHTSYENFPYRGTVLAAHLVRFLSVLMGAGTVLCTYAVARRLFPWPGWLAPAAAALNAFLPQFLFISASINNDVLITLLGALTLWLLVCIAQDGPSVARFTALGAVLGLASLSKLNGLVLVPLAVVVLLVLAWKRRQGWAMARWTVWTFATAALVGGWWYVRNLQLYGDPFGLQLMFAVLPPHAERPTGTKLLHLLDGALKSFFGVFGWFNIVMDSWLYVLFEISLLIAILGLLRFLYLRVMRRHWTGLIRVGLLAFWSVVFVVALAAWSQARFPQGRLLFPAMPAIATLLMLGLVQWLPARYARSLIAGLLLALLALASVVPYHYIAPAYARAQPLTATERAAITHPLTVDFGGQVRLLGYDLTDQTLKPGSRLWLVLYWEGLAPMDKDYSVFVHLVDDRGVTIAQRDSYPGAGSDPTRDWKVGWAMRDVCPLDVPAPLLAQGPYRIRVGLYDYASRQRLPVMRSESGLADFVERPVELSLEGESPATLHEVYFDFGGQIVLTGYSVQPIAARPGDTLKLVLRWQALKTLDEDYTVFAHLMREGAQIWGQCDHVPMDGRSPTSSWAAGQIVSDKFDLRISPDAPDDSYELVVGLYESATVTRLSLPNGLDFVVLGKIEVKRE